MTSPVAEDGGAVSFVVTRPYTESNVGSNLASMAGALYLARRLGRGLVVDWRGQVQLADESTNYFSEFFETPAEFGGVRVLYAPSMAAGDYSPGAPDACWLEAHEARRVAAGESKTPKARALVLEQYHGLDRIHPGPEALRFRFLRSFYGEIRPSPLIARLAEDWWREHRDGAFVIGVNIRTGNGHYFGKGMPYEGRVNVSIFEDRRAFLRMIRRAIDARARRLPRSLRDAAVVFFATDAEWMSELLAQLPNAATRRSVFPPLGTGDTFKFSSPDYSDRDSIVDTLVDMFLLARCDALVYNSSMFNQYARVLSGNFSGNQVHVETLYARRRIEVRAAAARRWLRRR